MTRTVSRRSLMKGALLLAPALALMERPARADSLPPLDANDVNAKSLQFVPDAAKIDAHANPSYKPGQHCGTCAHFKGKAADASAACEIFAGHSVPGAGWCLVWGARPA